MATKVSYKQGTKATYLGLSERLPSALYFCTDTRELFKGDDLYSDGLRVVESFAALPAFQVAADGILYVCADSGCGYTLNKARNAWLQVIFGVDQETLEINDQGLMQVKAVPVDKIAGLDDHVGSIVEKAVGDLDLGVATPDKAGAVKPGSDFEVGADGTLSLAPIEISKVEGLEDRLSNVEKAQVGGVHYRGSVATVEDLPKEAEQGDLYEVKEDNSEWCWNGEQWFEYGKTTELSHVAKAELNPRQFEIKDGVLNLVGVDSSIVFHRGESLQAALDEMYKAVVWEDMGTEVDTERADVAAVLTEVPEKEVVKFSAGNVSAPLTIEKSVTLAGSAAGFAQNFAQEV